MSSSVNEQLRLKAMRQLNDNLVQVRRDLGDHVAALRSQIANREKGILDYIDGIHSKEMDKLFTCATVAEASSSRSEQDAENRSSQSWMFKPLHSLDIGMVMQSNPFDYDFTGFSDYTGKEEDEYFPTDDSEDDTNLTDTQMTPELTPDDKENASKAEEDVLDLLEKDLEVLRSIRQSQELSASQDNRQDAQNKLLAIAGHMGDILASQIPNVQLTQLKDNVLAPSPSKLDGTYAVPMTSKLYSSDVAASTSHPQNNDPAPRTTADADTPPPFGFSRTRSGKRQRKSQKSQMRGLGYQTIRRSKRTDTDGMTGQEATSEEDNEMTGETSESIISQRDQRRDSRQDKEFWSVTSRATNCHSKVSKHVGKEAPFKQRRRSSRKGNKEVSELKVTYAQEDREKQRALPERPKQSGPPYLQVAFKDEIVEGEMKIATRQRDYDETKNRESATSMEVMMHTSQQESYENVKNPKSAPTLPRRSKTKQRTSTNTSSRTSSKTIPKETRAAEKVYARPQSIMLTPWLWENMTFKDVTSVAFLSDGRVALLDGNFLTILHSRTGRVQATCTLKLKADVRPLRLFCSKSDSLIVSSAQCLKFILLSTLGAQMKGTFIALPDVSPDFVALVESKYVIGGKIWSDDLWKPGVSVFDSDCKLKVRWKVEKIISEMAVNTNSIFLCIPELNAVQVHNLQGALLYSFGDRETLLRPMGICVNSNGDTYVTHKVAENDEIYKVTCWSLGGSKKKNVLSWSKTRAPPAIACKGQRLVVARDRIVSMLHVT